MSLIHIAGYLTRGDEYSDQELCENYGDFTQSLDRADLKVPADSAYQWTIYCFLMFAVVKDKVCRRFLSNVYFDCS